MTIKERAKKLKTDIPALFLALKDRKTPVLAKLFAAITVIYALSPIDLIPDFIPVLGYLDSVAQIRSAETIELFSHTRPNGEPWHSLIDVHAYPYIATGENICMTSHIGNGSYTSADKWVGSQPQIEAAASWIFVLFKNSSGHYSNMINANYKECGIGISYEMHADGIPMFYLAHIFGAR